MGRKKIPGLPDRQDYRDIKDLPTGKLLKYVLQEHNAKRAGKHYDFRLGDDSMYSWALPKGLPAPGKKHLAIRQPQHTPDYNTFEGEIPEGTYGAGKVRLADKGSIIVDSAEPGKINLTVAHRKAPENYSLIQTKDKNWLLINTTPQTSEIHKKHKKVHYDVIPEDKVDDLLQGKHVVSAKIDGAAGLFHILKDRIEALSYRTDKQGRPIVHTKRIGGLENLKIPKNLVGKMLRGEIYGVRKGKAIPPQELGGILNASLENAIRKKQEKGIELRAALFNILGDDRSYPEKLKDIKGIIGQLPQEVPLDLPPLAESPEGARELYEKIRQGSHPLTSEGLVGFPIEGGKPAKLKFRPEADVIIRKIFEAATKGEPRAGGFEYSLPDSEDIVGKVGTGFSHEVLKDMLANPEDYIGRRAVIKAQEQFPSGAYRAPSFINLHEDYNQTKQGEQKMTPYEQGFINKCAEYNVNPEQLVKQAFTLSELLTVLGITGALGGMTYYGLKHRRKSIADRLHLSDEAPVNE